MTYGRPMSAQFLKMPFLAEERNYSERTAELIDEETRRIVDEIYERARQILTMRRAEMGRIAQELILPGNSRP